MIMSQQDEDLTELGQGVDRLNELGQNINEELKVQNQMLTDLDRDIDEVRCTQRGGVETTSSGIACSLACLVDGASFGCSAPPCRAYL